MSDSQGAIKAPRSHVISYKVIWKCLRKLNKLGVPAIALYMYNMEL